jgi:hypothetical protein
VSAARAACQRCRDRSIAAVRAATRWWVSCGE